MTEISSLAIYIGVWLVALVYYLFRYRTFGIGATLLMIYLISSIFSMIFYITRSSFQTIYVTLDSLLYIQTCTFIIIYPFLYYSNDLSTVIIKEYQKYDKLYNIFILLAPFVIWVTIECLYGALTTKAESLGDVYEVRFDSGGKDYIGFSLSWLGERIYHTIGRFYYLWPILFFECLRSKGRMRKMSFVPLLCIISLLLFSYASASRVGIVRILMYVLIIFYFYRNSLEQELYRKILFYGSILGVSFVTLLGVISISRFSNMDTAYTMDEWFSLYLGEGPVRFSTYIWDLQRTSDGDTSFSLFKSFLGFDTYIDYYDRREYYESYFGIPTNIFYTFVGDWYQDFGRYVTPVICIIISLLEFRIIKSSLYNSELDIRHVFVLGLFAFFVMFGFMYYTFKTSGSQQQLVETAIALFIIIKYIK